MMKMKTKQPEAEPYNAIRITMLRKLVATGEHTTLEFKRKATYPEKIVKEMIAFANTLGGTLLIGVSDDRTLVGLKFPEEESYVIRKAVKRFCRPFLKFKEHLIPISPNKFILQYEIPSSTRKPHSIVYHRYKRETYIRVNDKSVKASYEMREIIKHKHLHYNVQFTYGEYERMLLQHLTVHPFISLKQFQTLSGLSRVRASKTLISLVLANILKITPNEKGDQYALAFLPTYS
jgi:hypothetical protein